jgi:hypothetical protein
MAKVAVSRIKGARRAPRRRPIEDRLFVRAPGLYRALSSLLMRLRPRSILRRALLRRRAASSFAAFNSGDFDAVFLQFAEDISYQALPPPGRLAFPARSVDAAPCETPTWRPSPAGTVGR